MTFQRSKVNSDVLPQVEFSAKSLWPSKYFFAEGQQGWAGSTEQINNEFNKGN